MKINQLGTLAIIGVVASFTAACGGSPIRPTAVNPPLSDLASTTALKLTTLQQVAVDQMCTAKSVIYDEYGNEIPEAAPDASTTDAPATPSVVCEAPAAPEQPQDAAVVSDPSSMESARFAHLSR